MKITDKKLILISLSVSLFSLSFFLFYRPEHPVDRLMVVGRFSKINNEVKRKMTNSLEWENVNENEEILSNDLLFTGKKSSAEIIYLSKIIKLKMPSNTVIKIEVEGNKPTFNIVNGSLSIEVGERTNFDIKKGGKTHTVNNDKTIDVNINERGNVQYTSYQASSKISENKKLNNNTTNNSTQTQPIDSKMTIEKQESQPPVDLEKRHEKKIAFYIMLGFSLIIFGASFIP
jgi:hypothetical protein